VVIQVALVQSVLSAVKTAKKDSVLENKDKALVQCCMLIVVLV